MSNPSQRDDLALEQILAQVAFQLRSSLSNIHLSLNRLAPPERREADPETDANAAILTQSYFRILRLVNNLTDAAQLTSTDPIPLYTGDLVETCRACCADAAPLAALLGLTLQFSCPESAHLIAFSPQGIERLLLNLLSNAMKFTPRGGAITVALSFHDQEAELSVSDTGSGIAPEMLPILFDRYRHFRVDPTPHGLGLGLPICHRIAQGMGGRLEATSALGAGTRVSLFFPDQPGSTTVVRQTAFDYAGGFDHRLLELSDALPPEAFRRGKK